MVSMSRRTKQLAAGAVVVVALAVTALLWWEPWQGTVHAVHMAPQGACTYDRESDEVVGRAVIEGRVEGSTTFEIDVDVVHVNSDNVDLDAMESAATGETEVRVADGRFRETPTIRIPMEAHLWDSEGYQTCMWHVEY